MCCIIHRPKGAKTITDETLKKVIKKNPHGWGISFINSAGVLEIEKSMDMDKAFDYIRKIEEQDLEFIFHARWATKGDKIVENCHPFQTSKGVIAHNGTMKTHCWNKTMSDSWHFARKLSSKTLSKRSVSQIATLCAKEIEKSRLAFLFNDGTVEKVGSWTEIDGVFYSSETWKNTWIGTSTNNTSDYDFQEWGYGGYGIGYGRYRGSANNNHNTNRSGFVKNTWPKVNKPTEGAPLPNENNGTTLHELEDKTLIRLMVKEPAIVARYMHRFIQKTMSEKGAK